MLLAPRRSSTAAECLRVVAAWLVLIVLFEGFSVVQSRAAGPLHRHQAVSMAPALTHGHAHEGAARHYHYVADDGLATAEEVASLLEALDAATSALSVAFALLAIMVGIQLARQGGRVWCAAPRWAWLTAHCALPLRPPQAA